MCTYFICGCWDYKEIEKRGYVLGIAIDKADNKPMDTSSLEYMPLEATGPLYKFTIEIPIISRSQNKPTGQSGANADKERDWNLSTVANTFFEANREYSTRLDYAPYYTHLQSIVISEEAAMDNIAKLLDMFLRDPEMRRRTKVFITPGRASEVLNVIPKIDDYSALYLKTLPTNKTKTSRLLHKTDLGKISEAMHEKRDFVLPKVIANSYEIKDAGCAVFKDNNFAGWLDEIKTSYLKWVTNTAKGGIVTINLPQYNNAPIVLEVKKVQTKQRPIPKDDSLEIVLDIKASLSLGEISSQNFINVLDEAFISGLEELAEKKIQKQIESTISYVQKEFGADVFLFNVNTERFSPETWDKVKDNWNETFKTLKISVNLKVQINQIGLIK